MIAVASVAMGMTSKTALLHCRTISMRRRRTHSSKLHQPRRYLLSSLFRLAGLKPRSALTSRSLGAMDTSSDREVFGIRRNNLAFDARFSSDAGERAYPHAVHGLEYGGSRAVAAI